MTFRDTVIVNPLFMPIVFRGDYLPKNLIFYNFDSLKERTPYDNLYRTDSIFKDLERNKQFEEMAYKYVQNNYPTYFRYSERDLPNEVIKPKFIKKNIYEDLPIKVEADANFEDVDVPLALSRSGDTGYRPLRAPSNSPRTTFRRTGTRVEVVLEPVHQEQFKIRL